MPALRDMLKGRLTNRELFLLPSSFDVVGDIAVFSDFPEGLVKKEKLVADALLKLHKNIRVVCKKVRKYSGELRLPRLKILAGERRKETTHKENGIVLKLNVERVYFSPRLASERLRIASQVKPKESVLVMFSGCGPYTCLVAKRAKEVFAVELNPAAHKYAAENILLNHLSNVRLFRGDVRRVVPKLERKFDRILMPLPKDACSFLALALSAAKKGAVIHYYSFLPEAEFAMAPEQLLSACRAAGQKCRILAVHRCGQFSPRVFRVCLDFRVCS